MWALSCRRDERRRRMTEAGHSLELGVGGAGAGTGSSCRVGRRAHEEGTCGDGMTPMPRAAARAPRLGHNSPPLVAATPVRGCCPAACLVWVPSQSCCCCWPSTIPGEQWTWQAEGLGPWRPCLGVNPGTPGPWDPLLGLPPPPVAGGDRGLGCPSPACPRPFPSSSLSL